MDILKDFGINWYILTAQIVNFLIILYLIKRFLLKPILNVLEDRKKAIKEGLEQAEQSKKLLEETEVREKQVLRKAQDEARKILDETKKQRDQILLEAETAAKNSAQKILEDARKQIVYESKEAQKNLTMQISGLAVELLEKSASQIFTKEDQDKVIQHALEKIKKRVD